MKRASIFINQISSPIQDILPEYDVVVIGSGYGGGIAASRLARAGKRLCVLERGRERLAGDFPDSDGVDQDRFDQPGKEFLFTSL